MKLFITLISVFTLINCSSHTALKPQQNPFILNNINIIDVANRKVRLDKSILISEGKIQKIAPSPMRHISTDIKVIEGDGGYITPGLIDMHVHMYEQAALTLALSHGVTHVRIMNGVPNQLKWRDQVAAGELIGSSATVSSPIISAYDSAYLHHTVHTADQATAAVKLYQSQGYDLIKAYGNLSEKALTALIKASMIHNIPIAKHGPHASGNMPVSKLIGLQSFEHVEDIYQGPLNHKFAPNRLSTIAEDIKATNVPVTPTLNIYYQLTQLSNGKAQFLNSIPTEYTSDIIAMETSHNQVKRWLNASKKMAEHNQKTLQFLQHITQVFHDAGITLLVGSDSGVLLSPHGLATHNEMQLMLKSGLSTFDVLAAATTNPAKALKLDSHIGRIMENYNADLILSKTNPLQDLSVLESPEAVVKNGVFYSKETLKELKDNAIKSRSLWEEIITLLGAL
ncbi:amidohydrolase family protein [Pseudoalteromonas sp. MMG013]|uniref:amidohydrolase family protein n=1 Tax=Pseudoalteromonas sp. MMG013 TaxID=2822687 RepID=UPI001B38BF79|nr:amidohydrolase family protein [Pseudoalteromonas sp. MMG013]MBQ4863245.1 amidohydrolase family protein [Pseudoalteromonas sp. MMG013]